MKYASARRCDLLLFDPDAREYAADWIGYLLDWVARAGQDIAVWLAIPPSLADDIANWTVDGENPEVHIVPLDALETALCKSTFRPLSGFARWWTMRRRLQATGAACGLFLSLDNLSLPFGLGLKAGGRAICGILFRPSVHYPAAPEAHPPLRERLRHVGP